MDRARGSPHGPVLGGEFNSPEMRAWREKFDAYACAFFRGIAKIDDAALLLFLGGWVDENYFRADLKLFLEIEQAAMRVNHDRLAIFPEFLSEDVLSRCAHGNAGEDPRASALAALMVLVWRHTNIVQRERG
jgi:hypothetical protein